MPQASPPDETTRLSQLLAESYALVRVSGEINRSLEIEDVLRTSQAGIREVLGGSFGAFLLFDSTQSKLELAHADGLGPAVRSGLEQVVKDFDTRLREADPSGTALLIQLGSCVQDAMKAAPEQSSVVFPLTAAGAPVGVLLVGTGKSGVLMPLSIELLLSMGEQIGRAIENARLHASVRDSEEWSRTFIENSLDGFWEGDFAGHTMYVNAAASRILGYPRDELLRMNINYINIDAEDARAAGRELRQTGRLLNRLTQARASNGSIKTLSLSTRLICDERGNPVRFQTIFRDMTELQQRVTELDGLARFSAACASSLDPDLICNNAIGWIKKLLGADASRIRLFDGDELLPNKAFGYAADMPIAADHKITQLARGVIRTGQPFVMSNLETMTHLISSPQGLNITNLRGFLAVAIPRWGSMSGVVAVMHTHPHDWSQPEIDLVQTIANQLGNALHNAQLFQNVLSQERKVDAIFNSGLSGLFATDAEGHFTMFNAAAEQITGWPRDLVIGRKWEDILVDRSVDPPQRPLIYTALHHKQVQFVQDGRTIQTRQGRVLPVAKAVAPLLDEHGKVTGAVGGIWDLSREKAAERDQEDFMNYVAHQIRTPLTAILSGLELLDNPRLKPSKRKELKQLVQDQAERLTKISGEFLDIQRASSPTRPVVYKSQSVTATMERIIREYEAQRTGHPFTLARPAAEVSALADGDLLDHILHILIDNAIRYSTPHSPIALTVNISEEDDNILVAVHNEGPGIPEQEQAHIFNAFHRVSQAEGRDVYGHGLGLYIALRFARRMQGDISFRSKENEGCTFHLSLRRSHE